MTQGFFEMLSNVSSFVDILWYLGIPFNDTSPFRLAIPQAAQSILGNRLSGLQVGDQPDQYTLEGFRPYDYSPNDYAAEFGQLIDTMSNPQNLTITDRSLQSDDLIQASKILIGPNIITGGWTPEMVWNTGFVDDYTDNLAALSVEQFVFFSFSHRIS